VGPSEGRRIHDLRSHGDDFIAAKCRNVVVDPPVVAFRSRPPQWLDIFSGRSALRRIG
jgi:hypothetical protein